MNQQYQISFTGAFLIICSFLFISCNSGTATKPVSEWKVIMDSASDQFDAGRNEDAKALSLQVLEAGQDLHNDTLTGRSLTNLCRTALRDNDSAALAKYSGKLKALFNQTGDSSWLMFEAHMNAEMARMNGNFSRADSLYDQSLAISNALGRLSMYAADHFNKSIMAVDQGKFDTARNLIAKFYTIYHEIDPNTDDAYGLIAVAYLLGKRGDLQDAATTVYVTNRLFKEQDIVPDPADARPFREIEKLTQGKLSPTILDSLKSVSTTLTVHDLLQEYIGGYY